MWLLCADVYVAVAAAANVDDEPLYLVEFGDGDDCYCDCDDVVAWLVLKLTTI